jgi:hypothetical protein
MAINAKVRYVFSDQTGHGWSEIFYTTAPDISTAAAQAKFVGKARVAMLANNSNLVAASVSDEAVSHDALLIDPSGWQKDKDMGQLTSDLAWSAILCRLGSGGTYNRSYIVRGVPDSMLSGDPTQQNISGDFKNLFQLFVSSMMNNSFCIRGQARGADNPALNILDIQPAVLNTQLQLTLSAASPVAGTKARITGVLGITGINNKVWTLFTNAGNSCMIKLPSLQNYLGQGKLQPLKYIYVPITTGIAQRFTKRDTGGSPFRSHGRAKRRS